MSRLDYRSWQCESPIVYNYQYPCWSKYTSLFIDGDFLIESMELFTSRVHMGVEFGVLRKNVDKKKIFLILSDLTENSTLTRVCICRNIFRTQQKR